MGTICFHRAHWASGYRGSLKGLKQRARRARQVPASQSRVFVLRVCDAYVCDSVHSCQRRFGSSLVWAEPADRFMTWTRLFLCAVTTPALTWGKGWTVFRLSDLGLAAGAWCHLTDGWRGPHRFSFKCFTFSDWWTGCVPPQTLQFIFSHASLLWSHRAVFVCVCVSHTSLLVRQRHNHSVRGGGGAAAFQHTSVSETHLSQVFK